MWLNKWVHKLFLQCRSRSFFNLKPVSCHSLPVSNSQVYSNDEFDLWPVYSGERFRAFRPSCCRLFEDANRIKVYGCTCMFFPPILQWWATSVTSCLLLTSWPHWEKNWKRKFRTAFPLSVHHNLPSSQLSLASKLNLVWITFSPFKDIVLNSWCVLD